MGLAVHPEQAPVGVGHGQRVEEGVAGPFVPAQRQHHAQLTGQRGEALQDRAARVGLGQWQMPVVLFDAEVRRGEQLLQQNHLGALGGRLAHQLFGAV
ncbi:hypothetical protein D3C81_1838480 [compost metagenome]